MRLQADVEHDELDQPFARHERADGEALAPDEAVDARGAGPAQELAGESARDDPDDIRPGDAVVEEAEVGAEPGEREVEREEERGDEVFDLLGDFDGEAAFVRADEAREEGPEDGVDADDAREEGGAERDQQRERYDGLAGTFFEAVRAFEDEHEYGPDGEDEEQDEAQADEQDVERGDAGSRVDESDAQSEEDPAHDVVADPGGEDNDPDGS